MGFVLIISKHKRDLKLHIIFFYRCSNKVRLIQALYVMIGKTFLIKFPPLCLYLLELKYYNNYS